MPALGAILMAAVVGGFVLLTLASYLLSDGQSGSQLGGRYSEYDAPKGVRDTNVGRGSDFGTNDDFGRDVDEADRTDEPFVDADDVDAEVGTGDGGL